MQDIPLTYIDTSVISYLTGRTTTDALITLRQNQTHAWWAERGKVFRPVVSHTVLNEALCGVDPYRERRRVTLERIPVLENTVEIGGLARALLEAGALPSNSSEDATHIATCAYYDIKFLATWNFKHIHNERMWGLMEKVCKRFDYRFPTIQRPELTKENIIYEHTYRA